MKSAIKRHWHSLLTILLASVLAGTYAYMFLVTPYLLQQNSMTFSSIYDIETTSSILDYGTLTAVDMKQQTVDVDIADRYSAGGLRHYRLQIFSPAYIARQTLLPGTDGVLDSLSSDTITPLGDITPGEHVAVLISRDPNGVLGTNYILFGDPL